MGCPCEEMAGPGIELATVCIGHLWLFNNITPAEFEILSTLAKRKVIKKGEYVFHQDDTSNEMFLLKSGRVKLTKILENGNEMTLDIRKAGDFIGENIFSEDGTYPVNAVCMEDALSCGFTKAQMETVILEHPNIGLQMIKNMSERISQLSSKVGSMAETSIEDRLYSVLKQVASEHGVADSQGMVIQFPLTHEELSFLIGSHRVSVSRAMKNLKEAGRMFQQKGALVVASL